MRVADARAKLIEGHSTFAFASRAEQRRETRALSRERNARLRFWFCAPGQQKSRSPAGLPNKLQTAVYVDVPVIRGHRAKPLARRESSTTAKE